MSLFVVATPIGNLADMTFRAVEILKTVDVIAAEDTRQTRKLCQKYTIETPLVSFHSHSSDAKTEQILKRLAAGESVALVSDAGTPGISDPGFVLVSRALENGVEVVPIPGCCAAVTALSASGLPTDKFVYLGFLPKKKGRKTLLESLCDESRTTVFYESPHRIARTIDELAAILGGERRVVLARELTKLHEEFFGARSRKRLNFSHPKKSAENSPSSSAETRFDKLNFLFKMKINALQQRNSAPFLSLLTAAKKLHLSSGSPANF